MSIHLTKHERASMRNAQLFTNPDAMRSIVPSLFSTEAHPKMSNKYGFTNTYDILMYIHKMGFEVTSIQGGDNDYRKVMVRMRSKHHDQRDNVPEIVVMDSHDGSSRLKGYLGFMRLACMNGMVVGDIHYSFSFTHRSEDLMDRVKLEMADINTHVDRLAKRVDAMRNYTTSIGQRILLADTLVKSRWGEDKDGAFVSDMRQQLLQRRRLSDAGLDMYTIMNVIQENVLRGGMSYITNNTVQRVRPLSDVRRNLNVNQTLWNTAEELMKDAV